MDLQIYDCRLDEVTGMRQGFTKGKNCTVFAVHMQMFRVDTKEMDADNAFIFQEDKDSESLVLQVVRGRTTEYFIGTIHQVLGYLFDHGVYKSDDKYQNRLKKHLHKYFNCPLNED